MSFKQQAARLDVEMDGVRQQEGMLTAQVTHAALDDKIKLGNRYKFA